MNDSDKYHGDSKRRLIYFAGNHFAISTHILFIFIIALLLRCIALSIMLDQIDSKALINFSSDSTYYVNMAIDILNGTNQAERGFFTFGPVFASVLAVFFCLFGINLFPYLFFQILVSSLSCVLIYKLGRLLFSSDRIGLIAGLIAAVSYTSITLSMVILSDTVFFFTFLLSLIFLLEGLKKDQPVRFYISGALLGAAVLTRSLAQFWPLLLIPIVFLTFRYRFGQSNIALKKRHKIRHHAYGGIGLTIVIILLWVIRNLIVHDIPVVASASVNGLVKISDVVMENRDDGPVGEVWTERRREYMMNNNIDSLTLEDSFRFYNKFALQTIRNYPATALAAYFSLMWENINQISYYHRALFPKITTIPWEYKFRDHYLNYLPFIFTILGMFMLVIKKQYYPLFFLSIIYIYFAAMVGFGRWQGSRLFFPGQIAWSLLTAAFFYYISLLTRAGLSALKTYLKRP